MPGFPAQGDTGARMRRRLWRFGRRVPGGEAHQMKVLISADMEGTCGIVSWVQVMPPEVAGSREPSSLDEYLRGRERMTAEVNAAIEGALAGGADEVIVNDSHDGMRNLLPDKLIADPAVRFISGQDKPLGMVQGVDRDGISAIF